MQKHLNSVLNKDKRQHLIKRLETHDIAGRMNASYISEVLYKLIKGSAVKCITLSKTIMIVNRQLKQCYASKNLNTF